MNPKWLIMINEILSTVNADIFMRVLTIKYFKLHNWICYSAPFNLFNFIMFRDHASNNTSLINFIMPHKFLIDVQVEITKTGRQIFFSILLNFLFILNFLLAQINQMSTHDTTTVSSSSLSLPQHIWTLYLSFQIPLSLVLPLSVLPFPLSTIKFLSLTCNLSSHNLDWLALNLNSELLLVFLVISLVQLWISCCRRALVNAFGDQLVVGWGAQSVGYLREVIISTVQARWLAAMTDGLVHLVLCLWRWCLRALQVPWSRVLRVIWFLFLYFFAVLS